MTKLNAIPQDMDVGGAASPEAVAMANAFIEACLENGLGAKHTIASAIQALMRATLIFAPDGQAAHNAREIAGGYIDGVENNLDKVQLLRQDYDLHLDMDTKGSA